LMINSGSTLCRRSTWASWTARGRGWSISLYGRIPEILGKDGFW
jgi:hypothetical protein